MNAKSPLLAAGFFGATGVLFGAFGAHALRPWLAQRGMAEVWETAVRYQLIHAVALAAAAGWLPRAPGRAATWAVRGWIAGIILFSGSLYGLALGGGRWLGPVTPLGGLAFLAGWVCAAVAAWPGKRNEE